MCELVCHPAIVDREPCRDLPRKLSCDKDNQICWAEAKLYAQAPREEGGRKIGAHILSLEQAENWTTENNMEITSVYWPAKESEIDVCERGEEISPKRPRDNRPAWRTNKGPRGIPSSNCISGFDGETWTDRFVAHRRIRHHPPIATVSTNRLT